MTPRGKVVSLQTTLCIVSIFPQLFHPLGPVSQCRRLSTWQLCQFQTQWEEPCFPNACDQRPSIKARGQVWVPRPS